MGSAQGPNDGFGSAPSGFDSPQTAGPAGGGSNLSDDDFEDDIPF
jgi:hypothetical protein